MTRFELSTILSAQTPTRTILADGEHGEVGEQSEVLFIEVVNNVLIIHCASEHERYIDVPICSEEKDEGGYYNILGYSRELV